MTDFDHTVLGTREHPSLGLDTFGDAPLDGAPGNHAADTARGRRRGRPRRPRRRRLHRPGRAPPSRLRDLRARRRARRDRRPDRADPPRHRRHRAVVRRPDPGLRALRHPRRRVAAAAPRCSSGAGSFIESFGLFGLDLADYDRLFAEKLDLFAALQHEEPVTWEGSIRPPLVDQQVYPTTAAGKVPAWIGVGGTPAVRRTRRPVRHAADARRDRRVAGGVRPARRPLPRRARPARPARAAHRHALARATSPRPTTRRASSSTPTRPSSSPASAASAAGARTAGSPSSRRASPQGALFVGSPETVAQKIAWAARTLGLSRFQLKYSVGALPHDQRLESIRLYGEEVIPRVRELLAV